MLRLPTENRLVLCGHRQLLMRETSRSESGERGFGKQNRWGMSPGVRFGVMIAGLVLIAWFSGGPMLLVFLLLGRAIERPAFMNHAASELDWVGPFQIAGYWGIAVCCTLAILCSAWEGRLMLQSDDRRIARLGRMLVLSSLLLLIGGAVAVPKRMIDEPSAFVRCIP